MRVYPEKLAQDLERQLRPVYLLSGDEPLLSIRLFNDGGGLDYEVTVGYSLIVSGLQQAVDFFEESLAGNAFYTHEIPVINRSLSGITDFVEQLGDRIEEAGQEAPEALAAIEQSCAALKSFTLLADEMSS